MSWFSREWDGVHRLGCPLEDNEYIEHDYDGNHTWVNVSIEDAEDLLHEVCAKALLHGDRQDHECICHELMIDSMMMQADHMRKAQREGAW